MSLWKDTFRIELKFKDTFKGNTRTETITYEGSLKSAIRHFFNEYKGVSVLANFYNSKGEWIKEVGM
ncbi:TPA: hypothetical protein ACTZ5N_000102 [Bacillus cereus]